jgi:hypothetical protein
MSVAATSLVTLDQLKAYFGPGFEGNQNDALLELLIDSVSATFGARIDRTLAKATYTSLKLDGPDGPDLILPNFPVVSITSIYEDEVLLVENTDYYVDYAAGVVHRIGGNWVKGWHEIVITYVAGYVVQGATPGTGETALPADLKLACMIQVAREWKKTQGSEWGESSRTFPDGSTTRIERGLLKEVEEILVRYSRYGL